MGYRPHEIYNLNYHSDTFSLVTIECSALNGVLLIHGFIYLSPKIVQVGINNPMDSMKKLKLKEVLKNCQEVAEWGMQTQACMMPKPMLCSQCCAMISPCNPFPDLGLYKSRMVLYLPHGGH